AKASWPAATLRSRETCASTWSSAAPRIRTMRRHAGQRRADCEQPGTRVTPCANASATCQRYEQGIWLREDWPRSKNEQARSDGTATSLPQKERQELYK